MAIEVIFENNIPAAISEFDSRIKTILESCGLTAEAYAKPNCPVDTGALRNSITHEVSGKTCYVGSNMEYAPYVELGTGVYYPGGRKTAWCYCDGRGNWHMTQGQPAQPFLKPAVADHADTYQRLIENTLKHG